MRNEVIFILDRSGSMRGSEQATIEGYNGFLRRQKQSDLPALITTILFDDRVELLHDCIDIRETRDITPEEYYVRGSTALLDAVGQAVMDARERTGGEGGGVDAHVIFVIITDGLENASRRFTWEQVRQMITEQKERRGWEFVFLGADLSDMRDAERLGISRDKQSGYSKGESGAMFAEMSSQVEGFKRNGRMDSGWNAKFQSGMPAGPALPHIRVPGGAALLDTGSPVSFGDIPSVTIDGRTHPLEKSGLLADIQRNIGNVVVALLGMDILDGYDIIIRKSEMFAELYDARQSVPGIEIPVTSVMGVPMADVKLNGRRITCALDTGAHIQYIGAEHAQGARATGSTTDFYPGLGRFSTQLYQFAIEIGGESIVTEFGVLPAQLQMLMGMLGAGGILGAGCFRDWNLLICARGGYMKIWR